MPTSHERGHEVYYDYEGKTWRYSDNHEPAIGKRACKRCSALPTVEGHDACLGKIEGVTSACCGHGVIKSFIMEDTDTLTAAVQAITPDKSKKSTTPTRTKVQQSAMSKQTAAQEPETPEQLRQHRGLPAQVPQTNPKTKRRSEIDRRILLDLVQDSMVRGVSETQACIELNISLDELRKNQNKVIDDLVKDTHDSTALQVYAKYVMEQRGCVGELQVMINSFKTSKQHNALVGAVRAKSDILDKIVNKGQDMGLIDKRARRIEFIGQLDVRDLTEVEIARSIMSTIKDINELVAMGAVVDTVPEDGVWVPQRKKSA